MMLIGNIIHLLTGNYNYLHVCVDKCEFSAVTSNGVIPLSSMSKGEQSLINMIIKIPR